MLTKKQIKEIMDEVEYEWNEKTEKELQEQLIHWVGCYEEETHFDFANKKAIVPIQIANDFWRDLFSDVVVTIHKRVESKLKKFLKTKNSEGGRENEM